MKLRNIIAAGLMASMALVACNKENTVEPGDASLKSVEVNFSNLLSKSLDAAATAEAVKVQNFQIFFSDGTNFHAAYDADRKVAQTYFDLEGEDAGALDKTHVYHFVDASVNEVVVIGNFGSAQSFTAKAEIDTPTLKIADQQYDKWASLTLYGEDNNLKTGAGDEHGSNYYTASVTLAPRVSRIEIANFTYNRSEAGTRKYSSLNISHVALNKYYTESTVIEPVVSVLESATIDNYEVWNWFETLDEAWHNDQVDYTLDEAGEYTLDLDPRNVYHFFPSTTEPQIVVRLNGIAAADGAETPLYLATKDFGGDITSDVAQIYVVNFAFQDEDLDNPLKCVEVSVDVKSWVIVSVTPTFPRE